MPYRHLTILLIFAAFNMVSGTVLAQENSGADELRGPIGAADGPAEEPTSPARAWRTSFEADATLTYFRRGDDAGVIVVAAGEHDEVAIAADTLEAALRESDAFRFVMNDDVLADNSKVGDQKIVEKAKHLPVGQVAVVRVYSGATGKPPTAVVTVYNKDTGEAATALSVTRGEAPKPSDRPPADSAPKDEQAGDQADEQASTRGADVAAKTRRDGRAGGRSCAK